MNATTTTTKKASKTKAKAPTGPVTLGELAQRFRKHLEQAGKSRGTVFSYGVEMDLAQEVLGADTPITSITEEQVRQFFECDRVNKTKGGRPKATQTVLKSERVLRLSLNWAAERGWLAKAPVPITEKSTAATATTVPTPADQI